MDLGDGHIQLKCHLRKVQPSGHEFFEFIHPLSVPDERASLHIVIRHASELVTGLNGTLVLGDI
ncbi:hypothetical protein GCM10009582_11560 [Arthrobacter flavus]